MMRTIITGASLVLPDRVATSHTLAVEGDRISDVVSGPRLAGADERRFQLDGHFVVPGFVDVHVHGVAGVDVLDGPQAVAAVAAALPRWGVTAFCPTSIACAPDRLEGLLESVALNRRDRPARSARVLPAHLESNFISPEYRGAQPLSCLRVPVRKPGTESDAARARFDPATSGEFSATQILAVIDRCRPDIGIITLAPEIAGGMELVRTLVAAGVRVSIGHSGATYEEARAAIAAGACHATHLFNRMSPFAHRQPGVVGAVLENDEVAAELVCDGYHVHVAAMRVAIAAKTAARIMAITDGTAGSGLPVGTRTTLGGLPMVVAEVARLDDGTIAGSVLTMDQAFARLVTQCGCDLVQAAAMCATTPARELRLQGLGVIAPGAIADLVILDTRLQVVETWIAGVPVWSKIREISGNSGEFAAPSPAGPSPA
jgi:N-acetylglucosamine-6-phosphate deacetylase